MPKEIGVRFPASTQRNMLRWMVLVLALVYVEAGIRCIAAEPSSGGNVPTAPSLANSATASDYIIGPGDTLQIFVWRNPDLTAQIPVRPDGKISTPLVENMMAVGKTTSELARDIESALQKYVRSPTVNVIVV